MKCSDKPEKYAGPRWMALAQDRVEQKMQEEAYVQRRINEG